MTKLNKNQLKKLYDYGGNLSPQDWSDMIDTIMPDDIEPGFVIKTTYDQAKELYNSNRMIPGVYYNFTYDHNVPMRDMVYISNKIDLNVYIDKSGDLKAKGTYILGETNSPEVFMFTSDYTFDNKYIRINDSLMLFKDETLYLPNISDDLSYINTIEKFLKDNNATYHKLNLSEDEDAILFKIKTCVAFVEYEEEDYSTEVYILDNGSSIRISTISSDGNIIRYEITINDNFNFNFNELTGYLYNLDFGNYKHSHVVDGIISGYDLEGFCIIKANVINDEFKIITDSPIYINSGTIINSTIAKEIDVEINTIYIINTHLRIDVEREKIILGDKYYGESVILSDLE